MTGCTGRQRTSAWVIAVRCSSSHSPRPGRDSDDDWVGKTWPDPLSEFSMAGIKNVFAVALSTCALFTLCAVPVVSFSLSTPSVYIQSSSNFAGQSLLGLRRPQFVMPKARSAVQTIVAAVSETQSKESSKGLGWDSHKVEY